MAALIVVLVGVAAHFLLESRKVLAPIEAAAAVSGILNAQAPPTVSFHTGLVKGGYYDSPRDVRYKLLEKCGTITVGKTKGTKSPVVLTAKGTELLKQIPGVKQSKDPDHTDAYVVR